VAAGLAAIKGLADMVGALPADGRPTLRLKVGVHTGPCLAIEANGVVDYFGRTVNIAARVESVANPNELVLSWAVLEDEDARAAVEAAVAAGASRVVDQRKVKGIAADVEVTRLAPRLA
jgi:class 3 adenylate cyclase